MTYSEKLRDSRWQKKRLEVLQREDFKCQWCKKLGTVAEGDFVQVHHGYYDFGREPWDYDSRSLFCLCDKHHKMAQEEMKLLKRLMGHVNPYSVYFFAAAAVFFIAMDKNFHRDQKIINKERNFYRIAVSLLKFANEHMPDCAKRYLGSIRK